MKSGYFSNLRAALTPYSSRRLSFGAAQPLHLPAFKDDFAIFVFVLLLTMNNALFDKRAVYFGEWDFEIYNCHDEIKY